MRFFCHDHPQIIDIVKIWRVRRSVFNVITLIIKNYKNRNDDFSGHTLNSISLKHASNY